MMLQFLTDPAKRVLVVSVREAERLHHSEVTEAHVLLALIRVHGVASDALKTEGLEYEAVCEQLKEAIPCGSGSNMSEPELTYTARCVIDASLEVARELNYELARTEHILLGLGRIGECLVTRMLPHLGVDFNDVQLEVYKQLAVRPQDRVDAIARMHRTLRLANDNVVDLRVRHDQATQSGEVEKMHELQELLSIAVLIRDELTQIPGRM